MLPMLDGDLTAIGVKHMKKMGMEFNLECPVQAVGGLPWAPGGSKNKAGETVSFGGGEGAGGHRPEGQYRQPEPGGCRPCANDRGRIIVNDKMEPACPACTPSATVSRAMPSWPTPPAPWAR